MKPRRRTAPARRIALALCFLGLAINAAAAAELSVQVGALPRVAVGVAVRPALTLEGGATRHIADVTPTLHTDGRVFLFAGVGLGYNFTDSERQSRGLIFRDVIGVGVRATPHVALTLDLVHYSNGGRANPVFGTARNGGYSGVQLGVQYRF